MAKATLSPHKSCPQSPFHEEKLLEFLESPILDLARNHRRVTDADVAAWLASVVVGSPKIEKLEELHAWQRKAVLAKDFLEKFPDCTPAKQFLERFKEKFGYEFGLWNRGTDGKFP